MRIRFSPFNNRRPGPAGDVARPALEPVAPELVPASITKPKAQRKTTVVHPDQEAAYTYKARLLKDGHRHIDTFFLPESLLAVVKDGHRPDVVLIHDFLSDESGLTGVELSHALRTQHGFGGLIYSTSDDHRGVPQAALGIYGFSGHVSAYFASTGKRGRSR